MANHCYNYLNIFEISEETSSIIYNWARSYSKYDTMKAWYDELLSVQNRIEEPCTRWFEVDNIELLNSNVNYSSEISLQGSTAWAPTEKLALAISKEFNCCVNLTYEESGNDIGGDIIYERGKVKPLYEGSYHGYRLWEEGIDYLYREVDNIMYDMLIDEDIETAMAEAHSFVDSVMLESNVRSISPSNLEELFTYIKTQANENIKR